jgi:hypothetical protein
VKTQGLLAIVGLTAGVTVSLATGCEGESKLTVVVEEGAAAPSVNLPNVPTLPPPPPTRHTDGSFTVYGIRHEALRAPADYYAKQHRVHGFIVSVYVPRVTEGPRRGQVCTQNDRCNEERPHVYIADARNERDPQRMMMVTGYATFQYEIDDARRAARNGPPPPPPPGAPPGMQRTIPTDFDEGAEVVVTGTLSRRAANGQADSNGLLEYISHTTIAPAPPPARNARR